ncbi:hypothetical protein CN930_13480 [Bacillus cereus]|nr:hypothetical protein CN930_13480 [Bacillus cereus]
MKKENHLAKEQANLAKKYLGSSEFKKSFGEVEEKKNFDFSGDIQEKRVEPIQSLFGEVQVNVTRYSNLDMAEMKLTSLKELIDSYENRLRQMTDINLSYAEAILDAIELARKYKAKCEPFEGRKGKGRPKLEINKEMLDKAMEHLENNAKEVVDEETGEVKRRVFYSKTYKYLQENYGYTGSDVSFVKALREEFPNRLPKEKEFYLPGFAVQQIIQDKINKAPKNK